MKYPLLRYQSVKEGFVVLDAERAGKIERAVEAGRRFQRERGEGAEARGEGLGGGVRGDADGNSALSDEEMVVDDAGLAAGRDATPAVTDDDVQMSEADAAHSSGTLDRTLQNHKNTE